MLGHQTTTASGRRHAWRVVQGRMLLAGRRGRVRLTCVALARLMMMGFRRRPVRRALRALTLHRRLG